MADRMPRQLQGWRPGWICAKHHASHDGDCGYMGFTPPAITQRSQMTYEQKLEILAYYLSHGRKAMRAKYNMTNQAAGHLLYHDKAIIEALEDEQFEKAGL